MFIFSKTNIGSWFFFFIFFLLLVSSFKFPFLSSILLFPSMEVQPNLTPKTPLNFVNQDIFFVNHHHHHHHYHQYIHSQSQHQHPHKIYSINFIIIISLISILILFSIFLIILLLRKLKSTKINEISSNNNNNNIYDKVHKIGIDSTTLNFNASPGIPNLNYKRIYFPYIYNGFWLN